MSLGPLYVLLREVFVQVFCPFFNWVVCLPGVELCEFFIYFGDQALSAHQQVSGSKNYGTFTQWNTAQQKE